MINSLLVKEPDQRMPLTEVRRRLQHLLPAPDENPFPALAASEPVPARPQERTREEEPPDEPESVPLAADPGELPFTPKEPPRRRSRLTRDKVLILLLGLPGGIALVLFHYVPLLGNVIAFQDYQPYLEITEAPFVGFSNFSFLWDGTPAPRATAGSASRPRWG